MKSLAALVFASCLFLLCPDARALTADEIIKLKKAGVSDEVITKMLEQESAAGEPGPVSRERERKVYRAGKNVKDDVQKNKEHERWKEKTVLENMPGVIIDKRAPLTPAN